MARALAGIVSYNNLQYTKRCVEALKNQTVPVDIVVWDNNSSDQTRDWLLSGSSGVNYVASHENVYWTPAVNRLFEQYRTSDHELLIMVNNDANPSPTCVERILECMDQNSEAAMFAPATGRIGGPQDVASLPEVHSRLSNGGSYELLEDLSPIRSTFVLGAFSCIRSTVWDEVGQLDEEMPLGADDHDYSIRVKDKGYHILVVQSAFCDHAGHASASSPGANKIWSEVGDRSWTRFNEKWAGYFASEEEAIKAHWGGVFHEGWVRGTGWDNINGARV